MHPAFSPVITNHNNADTRCQARANGPSVPLQHHAAPRPTFTYGGQR